MKGQSALYTVVGIGATLICLLGVSWIGPAGGFLNLLTPLAAAYLGMRFGLRSSLVIVIVTSALLLQLATTYTLAAYLGVFGVGSLLLPFFLRQQRSWDRSVLYATAGSAVATALMILFTVLVSGVNLQTLIDQMLQSEVDQAMQVYRASGFSDDQLQNMQQVVDGLSDFIGKNFYGLYFASLLAIQSLCLLLLQRLKGQHYHIAGIAFSRWRLPPGLIWVLIVAGFFLLLPLEAVSLIGRNLLVVLLPLYFLQGMAVVNSFLQKKTYPPLVKGLIYFLLLILNPLPIIITCAGVFDLWIDFRRPRQKNI
ncbi:Uncharacterized conserved protein YybS, DUF2232 family [Desulfuromusa kysingii]|uniref:Uncharacterized conserved protein YybS, DUF2232 family n=1 Tax=Desulfuromusa kysingii TaxID=37625 RepID=A0A1H3ZF17_9BACT|nr:DUF2232 domain-containing protein [Desulfuromusa kysingii]SEA21974.1 Uncharacterized conserved protein YybS, DUF2232 family [Desulfuromusa kysingii]